MTTNRRAGRPWERDLPLDRPARFTPRRIEDLCEPEVVPERMLRLARTRVLFADYRQLRTDFPFLKSGQDCDAWLLRHAAVVSEAQAAQTLVNTAIETTGETVAAHRPPRYGRSAVVEVENHRGEPAGMLDIKGVGVPAGTAPSERPHSDGLLSLDYGLGEVLNQLVIERVVAHAGVGIHPVPLYALLDPGFEGRERWSGDRLARPTAILVRRAHRRNPGNVELPRQGSVAHFCTTYAEMLLRHYGITSAQSALDLTRDPTGAITVKLVFVNDQILPGQAPALLEEMMRRGGGDGHVHVRLERLNIQTTRELSARPLHVELVDLGHYGVRSRFSAAVMTCVRDRPLYCGAILPVDHPAFVQPVPGLALPAEAWAEERLGEGRARLLGFPPDLVLSRDLIDCMSIASRLQRGELSGNGVRQALGALVERVTAHLG